ncbi:uncharacterized protein LOC141649747 [Silene latifolia]|uniref:uncharacterized protein LOC141649747 n=1 Tax=Silene latifolia TaxID=37657 RepID=UPI003D76EE60
MTNTEVVINPSPTPSYNLVHVEHTGHSITPIVFDGTNYDEWSRSFLLALLAKGKVGYVDGTVKTPSPTSDTFEAWQSTNALVTMWIFNTLHPNLRKQIGLRPEAKQVWLDLKNRFCQANEARIYQLQTDLHACRQGASESLVDYYGRLTAIWDALMDQNPLPKCACADCKCNWKILIGAEREKTRVRDFLMGLDSRFSNTRSQILGISPLPSLDIIYNRLLQDEGVRNLSTKTETKSDVMAFVARASNGSRSSTGEGRRNPNEPSKYFCVICQKPGHHIRFCYQVTGNYPDTWGDRPRPRVSLEPAVFEALCQVPSRPNGHPDRGSVRQNPGQHASSASHPKAHIASGKSVAAPVSAAASSSQTQLARFDNIDLNTLTPEALEELGRLLQARQSDSTSDRLNGYPFGKKGWCLYDLDTGDFFNSRDVVFIESEFPYQNLNIHDTSSDTTSFALNFLTPLPVPTKPPSPTTPDTPVTVPTASVQPPSAPSTQVTDPAPSPKSSSSQASPSPVQSTTEPNTSSPDQPPNQVPSTQPNPDIRGRGQRLKLPNSNLKDFILSKPRPSLNSLISTSPSSGTTYPISHYISYNKFSANHKVFLAAVTKNHEPTFYKDAVLVPEWREAMRKEIDALEKNNTWTLEPLPQGKKAIGSKWVYKIKYHADGSIERYKARLVIMGNRQIEGVDYNETFAPTVKLVTVRTLLAIAAAKGWVLHQMDVHNAFLHGDLQEEVYMRPPPGFHPSNNDKVCRLRKSLYGLRQAPRCWYAKLASALRNYGFKQCALDHSLFSITKDNIEVHVLVYVDDLVICGNNVPFITKFKDYLSQCFSMKDLGVLKYFLGLEIARNQSGIFISQRKYALDILQETGLLGSKPAPIPMEPNHKLATSTADPLQDPQPYRRIVGKLVYLTITRPELTYSVHTLAQFMNALTSDHWHAALTVVRYLKSCPAQGILLRSDSTLRLNAYCDASYAPCPISRRSLSAYIVFLGSSPISWKTKKQATVSLSSAESEYRAMAFTVCELKWLKSLLGALGIPQPEPIPLRCDNESALHIARNPVFHERTKHIEIDCHFIRDEILKGLIIPSYVHTKAQLADILTKALGRATFEDLLSKLGVSTIHSPTCGGLLATSS